MTIMHVDKTHSFRPGSARDAWYERLKKFDGKHIEAFVANCKRYPPSTPPTGMHAGHMEPINGWLSFFMGRKKQHPRVLLTLEEKL